MMLQPCRFANSLHLALWTLAIATAVGCARLSTPPISGMGQAHGLTAAAREDTDHPISPCDPGVMSGIDLTGPNPTGIKVPARPQWNGEPGKPAYIEMKSPNQNVRPGGATDVTAIVLHHTSSMASAERIGKFFQDPESKVSSHYVVGKDGVIVQCVADTARSWHAGKSEFGGRPNVNDFTVGIEICNTGEDNDPYPPAQYESLGRLMAYLMIHHKVAWAQVTRHRDVARPLGRKDDTSDGFNRAMLVMAVVAAGGPSVETPRRSLNRN